MAMIRTYTETYDMNTEEGCPTLLGIHTPIGPTMYNFLAPAFQMYKKYKYLGCDVTVVNAARLPVDPEQVGKIAGTNYVDPRDTLNPIMFKGCHGESLAAVLDSMYNGLLLTHKGSSLDKEKLKADLEAFYYTALGDDGWRKSNIQKTLSLKNLHPMVYSLATQHQLLPTNSLDAANYKVNNPSSYATVQNIGNSPNAENGSSSGGTGWSIFQVSPSGVYPADGSTQNDYIGGNLSMFTSKMQRLGWLDTMQYVGHNAVDPAPGATNKANIALLPKVQMGILMLPPSYLCRQYLRVIIRHKIKFAGFRTITTGGSYDGFNSEQYQSNYGYWYTGNTAGKDAAAELREVDLDNEPIEGDLEDE